MEIKSRGYDRDTERWYFGAYFKHQLYEICPVMFSGETAADKEPKYQHYIVFDGTADWNMDKPIKLATVDSKSVGTFIGRKDSKGKEIYSGDILKLGELIGAVVYLEKSTEFAVVLSDETVLHDVNFEQSEIVGNTYQNIDLLA
mgnify:CR=1 FL=1